MERDKIVDGSAIAAGMWAKIDGKRGVWKAPAGVEARLTGAAGLEAVEYQPIEVGWEDDGSASFQAKCEPPRQKDDSIADKYIRCGDAGKVLVCGAETLTQVVNWERRDTAVLFGDGAGAMVLRRDDTPGSGILGTRLGTDGAQFELIHIPGVGFKRRPYVDQAQIEHDLHATADYAIVVARRERRFHASALPLRDGAVELDLGRHILG